MHKSLAIGAVLAASLAGTAMAQGPRRIWGPIL